MTVTFPYQPGIVRAGRIIHASAARPIKGARRPPSPRFELNGSRPTHSPDEQQAIETQLRRLRVQETARRRLASERAGEGFAFPPPGRTLVHDLEVPRRDQAYTIERIHPAGGSSLLVAQYKTGKTTLLLNLALALADGEPFLGEFAVSPIEGRIAFWNYEMDEQQFREWARDIAIEHPERVAEPLHLRGRTLRLWEPDVAEAAIEWLRAARVEFLIVDTAARAWRGLVENENDNAQVAAFTDALDTIKREAGVRDLILATHMGRASFEEGGERSRGATRLEDWMDAGWYLTKEKDETRALRAIGRDVDVDALVLRYEDAMRRLSTTGETRIERRASEGIQRVVDSLAAAGDGIGTTALEEALEGEKRQRPHWMREARERGYVERRREDGSAIDEDAPPGRGTKLLCYLTEKGRALHERKVSLRVEEGEE